MMPQTTTLCPIYSRFGGDSRLGGIVGEYVREMPDRVVRLRAAANAGDDAALSRLAHQMKGAAGSYGFDEVMFAAARFERAIQSTESEDTLDSFDDALENLIGVCLRVRAGAAAQA